MVDQGNLHNRVRRSFEDLPANASDLRTPQEIELEHQREELRMAQEARRGFGWVRKGFVAVLSVLVLVAVMAASTLAVGLLSGTAELVVPALSVLAGSGGAGVFFWRMYAERIPARA
ncbi:MAG TPA: hypothetical protein VNM38_13845 [Solirubrobacterales bacterium]|nr:hypothetical protein [Solirubrobacterales bacterium]